MKKIWRSSCLAAATPIRSSVVEMCYQTCWSLIDGPKDICKIATMQIGQLDKYDREHGSTRLNRWGLVIFSAESGILEFLGSRMRKTLNICRLVFGGTRRWPYPTPTVGLLEGYGLDWRVPKFILLRMLGTSSPGNTSHWERSGMMEILNRISCVPAKCAVDSIGCASYPIE
jgi:hypothetical protein